MNSMNNLVRFKKTGRKVNERPEYEIFLKDGDVLLGTVHYKYPSHGGGEKWGHKSPDGKKEGTSYQRSGAAQALLSRYRKDQGIQERAARLDQVGVEIVDKHYTHKGRRVLSRVIVANCSSSEAMGYSEYVYHGNWSGKVFGNERELNGFKSEVDLLAAAIKIMDLSKSRVPEVNAKIRDKAYKIVHLHRSEGEVFIVKEEEFGKLNDCLTWIHARAASLLEGVKDAIDLSGEG